MPPGKKITREELRAYLGYSNVTVSDKTRHMRSARNARFGTSNQKMSKFSFCHIHAKQPFY